MARPRRHSSYRPRRQHLESLERRQLLASAVTGVGTGLIANYFSDTELNDLAMTRVDSTVNFDWGQGSPDPTKVPADGFGARWTGKVQAQFDETYTFYTTSDEGVALWVNGQQLIDDFTDHTLAEDSGTISLKAGELYDIRLDYYDNAFDASISLSWSSASTAKQIIPQSQLYGAAGWTSGGWLNNEVGNTSGSVTSVGSIYYIAGGGSGTSGTSDGFEYLYQTLEGDGTVVAKVNSTQGSGNGAEAGVMIRDTQNANAAYASVVVDSLGRPSFESRASAGATVTTQKANTASGVYWIKLVRDGDFFRGYASASGADNTWTYFGSTNVPMGRTVFAGITSTSGTNGGQNTAKFGNVQVVSTPPVGAGLEQVRDYSMGNPFVDIAKQARTFQGPNLGPNVATDANGWPLADFMTILLTGYANTAHLNNGTYKGSFTGQADIGTWLTPGGQIKNKNYDASTNTTTFDFVVNASESADGWYAALQMTNTRRNPGDPLNTGITNLRVIRPGYDPNTTQVFQDSYLQHLKQFSTLRFMDWTQTNNSTVANWSDRTTLTSARQSSTNGVAWEYVVQLANQLHKDIWINIPARATDDYITQLATLLKNTLDSDRVVYVEYSNEVWNGIFSQYSDNLNAAIAEVTAGNSPLNADGETNNVYWSWRRTAKRLKETSDLFASVWGSSAINGRVRPVLASQYSNTLVIQQGLEFIERTYGSPSKYFYGIAEAPYIAMGSIDTTNPNLTVDDIITKLQASADSNANRYYTYDTYARRYGLQNLAYEGGPDVAGNNNQAAKKAAMLDPRMEALVQSYLNGWYKAQGGLFNWFVGGPTVYGTTGMWGLSNLLDNWTAPKNLGTIDVATSQRTPLTWGQSVPAQFDARAVAGASVPYSTTYLKNSGKGKSFDYFVRAHKAGSYQIVFNAGTSDALEQLRVAINGTDVRTITLANTGSLTNFADNLVGTFQLAEGENLIHVTSVNEVAGWNIQTVTVAAGATPDGAPTVASPAQASPTSINSTTTNLSVLGADDGGESNLVYSWQAVNEAPTSVTFSNNGTNSAKNTTATFTRAGTYTLKVTISDGVSTTTSSVVVTVNQIVTSITIAPTGSAIANGETKQLVATAKDQFGVQLYVQPTFTWAVTNGFGTISSTGLYESPASGLGTANISASANGVTGTGTVITQSPRTADNPANAINAQLDYNYYQGSYSKVADFDAATPLKSGLINNFLVSPRQQTDNYAFQYQGYVYVPAAATYTFYVNSDDGSRLWVGTQLVVDNDGKHSAQEKSGQIILDQGWHQLKLDYFEATGGETLGVSYSGGGLSKQAIPDSALERVDRAPTVATPPTAIPNPVTNTQATLNVVGVDESGESILTYTWSATAKPSGAANPTFTVNGSNAAKSSIATFSKAGTYTLNVAISDGLLTTNATVNVTVNATLTSITISPQNPTVQQAHTQQFTATGFDQFGNTISGQTFSWSTDVNGGSIDSTGLYTAPSDATGTFNVTASAGTVSKSTTVNVTADAAPTVVTPAAANPNPVTGTSTQLSVLGNDDSGEANLTYTWAATTIPNGATAPTFSINGSNAAKNTTATFAQGGTYTFTVTLFDGFKTTTSSVDVVVNMNNNQAPVVTIPAAANPSGVTGNSTQLTVLGDDDGGESNLTYTWSVVGTPPASPTFSINGTNAAKNTNVTFTKAGTYNFLVTISDGTYSATSSVGVPVSQTLTSITVAPSSAFVTQGTTKQFAATALDQFGSAMASQPAFAWSVTSTGTGGTVNQSGLYTAPTVNTPTDTVIASANGINGSATVAVVAGSSADAFGNDLDIGSPSIPGSYSVTGGGVYTVKASGADIFGNADQFHYVYRTLAGDGQIIARVASVQNTNSAAKAGVMFREDLTAGGRHVSLYIRPDNNASLQYRSTANLGTSIAATVSGSAAPYWVKLVRAGNTFTGYRSADGANWVQVGGSVVISNMASTLYVGLALTSHNNSVLNTSTFDNAVVQSAAPLKGGVISSVTKTPTNSVGASSAPNAFDGDLSTYFSATTTSGNWVGVDFGAAKVITSIKYAPRSGYASRMIGGKFQASNSADFSKTTDLFTITSSPTCGKLTAKQLTSGQAFRYVRYLAPDGSFGNIAEMMFLGF